MFTAALQSVFPQTELGTFMSLVKRDKERQLQELTMIVTGIRLFNKECGKGGEGIDDCKHHTMHFTISTLDGSTYHVFHNQYSRWQHYYLPWSLLCQFFSYLVPCRFFLLKPPYSNLSVHPIFVYYSCMYSFCAVSFFYGVSRG